MAYDYLHLCLAYSGLVAPFVLDGPINGTAFLAWAQQALVRVLQPGDIVAMGNLGSHKIVGIADAIEAVAAQLRYLPPSSPDYNSIEQVFAKFKTLLGKTAARTMACSSRLCRKCAFKPQCKPPPSV